MNKRFGALLLAAVLAVTLVTGCDSSPAPASSLEDAGQEESQAGASSQAQAQESAATPTREGTYFEESVDWDGEYDVIVVGFGGAGAATAITAADEGAKVLLLEKAPEAYAGGNSAVCMQWIASTEDVAGAKTYIQALRGEYLTPSDSMIDIYVEEMAKNFAWFEGLGAPNPELFDYIEFPELPGAGSIKLLTVDGNTGMSDTAFGGSGQAYRLVKESVLQRSDNIEVWYEAPAVHLIQDGVSKIVHGVVAQVDGREVNLRAKNGVVLCCGGFENNPQLQQDYTQRVFWPSTGNAHYNTGDGIRMAMAVGADLWHMSNTVTNMEFYDEETQTSTFAFQAKTKGILVGGDATRFMNEGENGRHGKIWNHGNFAPIQLPDTIYSVFDQTAIEQGRLHFTWSEDSQVELEKGWIQTADTLEELAGLIGLDGETLVRSVETYNGYARNGEDLEFHRTANLVEVKDGPFYAVKVTPCMGNTQGGPVRNEQGEILDTNGNPIPHLYEAGELGDIWSNCYQAGNNLGGGFSFGRISGTNAAREKSDNMPGSVMEGGSNYVPQGASGPQVTLADNEYLGEGMGKGGTPIVVKVTLDGDDIVAIEIVDHAETPGLADPAFEQIPQAIIDSGSTDVDVVTSATLTSNGIIEAVNDAISKNG